MGDARRLIPPRWGWLGLIAAPSSYLLLASFALVAIAKAKVLADLEGVTAWPLVWLWAIASDALVHIGLAALFLIGEASRRWLIAVTTPLAALLAIAAVINAAHLSTTGEQLSVEAVSYGLDSFDELLAIVTEEIRRWSLVRYIGVVLVLVFTPFGAWYLVQSRRPATDDANLRVHASHCAGAASAVALLIWLLAPGPSVLAAERLGHNATVDTYWSWITDDDPAAPVAREIEFTGYDPVDLVSAADIAAFATRQRPNVVLLILESTRYDVTLGDPDASRTPTLRALAGSGTSVPVTRAALPHTTKSVFSMLCGRLPLMQRDPIEVSTTVHVQCLPRILSQAGYRTAFFQSALGTFEHRPRLVAQLGYQAFAAWENIGGQPLGYLASDDESLSEPVARWLDDGPAPFFVTVLTSAPHHPYRLPGDAVASVSGSDEARYLDLVAAEDRLLGALLAALDARGVRDQTIVVVAGDHGEGFGAKGVRQHDNNFFEEGLRVPLVFAGPGVPVGEVAGNASLIDVTPSLLHLLGLPVPRSELARDLFAGPVPDVPRYFGCYYDSRCRGFVLGDRKFVFLPERNQAFYFDLAADPDERAALRPTPDLLDRLPELHRVIDTHRTRRYPVKLGEVTSYGEWSCPIDQPCRHPKSPRGAFFESP